jgi:hypothetical protein
MAKKQNPGELPAGMLILGLLSRRPNQTVEEVQDSLDDLFASCRFHRTTALNSLQQMSKAASGRPRVKRQYEDPGSRLLDRYDSTEAGFEVYQTWMAKRPEGRPAIRDAMDGRIALCRLEDLPDLIVIAREERDLADFEYRDAKSELTRDLERTRSRGTRAGQPTREELEAEAHAMALQEAPRRWSERSEHYARVAKGLEDICNRGGIPFPPDPKRERWR